MIKNSSAYVVWWRWPSGRRHGRQCNGGAVSFPVCQYGRFLRYVRLLDLFGIPWRSNARVSRDLFGRYFINVPF